MTKQAIQTPAALNEPILSINNIEVVYNDVILVLHGVSLDVADQQIVALLGANGAGKSTTLKAISALLKGENGAVTRGNITFMGENISDLDPSTIVKHGIIQVMEGRRIIEDMTIIENLKMGAYSLKGKPSANDMEMVFHYFPVLQQRKGLAGYLSGGEQQMLAIGRALMARPKLILLDEPSMGLSPLLVKEVFSIIEMINKERGIPILLVEQNANMALRHADVGYIMENGKIVLHGSCEDLRNNEDVREFYLGASENAERRSFKNLKSYKRRKRWL